MSAKFIKFTAKCLVILTATFVNCFAFSVVTLEGLRNAVANQHLQAHGKYIDVNTKSFLDITQAIYNNMLHGINADQVVNIVTHAYTENKHYRYAVAVAVFIAGAQNILQQEIAAGIGAGGNGNNPIPLPPADHLLPPANPGMGEGAANNGAGIIAVVKQKLGAAAQQVALKAQQKLGAHQQQVTAVANFVQHHRFAIVSTVATTGVLYYFVPNFVIGSAGLAALGGIAYIYVLRFSHPIMLAGAAVWAGWCFLPSFPFKSSVSAALPSGMASLYCIADLENGNEQSSKVFPLRDKQGAHMTSSNLNSNGFYSIDIEYEQAVKDCAYSLTLTGDKDSQSTLLTDDVEIISLTSHKCIELQQKAGQNAFANSDCIMKAVILTKQEQ